MNNNDDKQEEIILNILIKRKISLNDKEIIETIIKDLENKSKENPNDENIKKNINILKEIIF